MNVVVRRSALKMWLMAMGGIPLLVISLDVLTQRRITRWLTELMFRPEDVQIFEPRDVIFAWVMFLFGAFLVSWGLKELFLPTKVIECRDEGLAVRLEGPHRGPSLISWDNIRDVGGADIDDDGDLIPLLVVTVFDRDDLPDNPWGARWVAERELGILAQDFDADPQEVAERIADYAVDVVERKKRQATSSLWKEDS
ncbi:MAG TPA: hypothetical protein VMM14_01360 [Acidimicrobiia bacterium]|nr:hypothetical protein [Acidimicrobiia bacterium]